MRRITFEVLRAANVARLPRFRNKLGLPAHSEADGSDWALSTWCNAVLGELGELAGLIKKVERGDISLDAARPELLAECADVLTYLDVLAFRLGVDLGKGYRVAFDGGDVAASLSRTLPLSTRCITVAGCFGRVIEMVETIESCPPFLRCDGSYAMGRVVMWLELLTNYIGGDLGDAAVEKFNLVSRRVGAGVFITGAGEAVHVSPPEETLR